jgi:hypothetical protein
VDTEFNEVANAGHAGPGFGAPDFLKVPPEQVVREALLAVERDRARVIPGWVMFLLMSFVCLIPFAFIRLGLNASVAGLHEDEEEAEDIASERPVR